MIYGEMIVPIAFGKKGSYVRDPKNIINSSDMSGHSGMEHTTGTDIENVWLSKRDWKKDLWIAFDFGSIVRLGYMCIWNINQSDGFNAGLKNVKIFYSYDNEEYYEFKNNQYPFVFAKASGKEKQKATNLDDRKNSPINFEGLSARFIKIVPDTKNGNGCHGKYIEGQTRYGLSQVRFFQYNKAPEKNKYVYARAKNKELDITTSNFGIQEGIHNTDLKSMYLSEVNPDNMDMVYDLNMFTFIKGLDFINYNNPDMLQAGLKNIIIKTSVNGFDWEHIGEYQLQIGTGEKTKKTKLTNGEDIRFEPVYTRYIKITVDGGSGVGTYGMVNGFEFRYGLSKVFFLSADNGYFVESARDWTNLFSNYSGWTGSDGIFITNINGDERKVKGKKRKNVKNLITFGDTFIGNVNPVTKSRKQAKMVNNSICYMDGLDPTTAKLDFIWGENGNKKEGNLIASSKDYIYWLQDCAITNNKFYSFADNIVTDVENEELLEGFKFHLVGVDLISFDMVNGKMDLKSQKSIKTPLYVKDYLYFGCGLFSNTTEAGMENPDEYIYIYGVKENGNKNGVEYRELVVARTTTDKIEDFKSYRFFDGINWSEDILDSMSIADDLSPEMSILPIDFGKYKGKYAYIYSSKGVGNRIIAKIGETPYGPFNDELFLFDMNKIEDLDIEGISKIYQYNAKAHYNIADEDEILITYNVNTMDYESHLLNGDIYRPRFVRYKEF